MTKFSLKDKFKLRNDIGLVEINGIFPAGSAGNEQTAYVIQGEAKMTLKESDLLKLFEKVEEIKEEVEEEPVTPKKKAVKSNKKQEK